ncbi:MAG TPA: hypothetical protein VFA63_07390 [Pseudonocardiaceae bacterium]|nr:hypothetical protein [Pseudonocardiaceae bacterium]
MTASMLTSRVSLSATPLPIPSAGSSNDFPNSVSPGGENQTTVSATAANGAGLVEVEPLPLDPRVRQLGDLPNLGALLVDSPHGKQEFPYHARGVRARCDAAWGQCGRPRGV